MICTAWNVRGINDPFKIKEVKTFLSSHKVAVCALLETRVRCHNVGKVQKSFGKDWSWFCNYSHSPRGRIWIGWQHATVTLQLIDVKEQFIVCNVLSGRHNIKLVVVYGLHSIIDRRSLWSGVQGHVTGQSPMMVIGDFNDVCHSNDRKNGALITEAETIDFEEFLLNTSLLEARSTGLYYSWSNSSLGEDRIVSRIDKAFVNQVWMGEYAEVVVQYLAPGGSDHSPLMFDMDVESREGGRPFKFLNVMAEHEDFKKVVQEAWLSVGGNYKLQMVWGKIKAVKKELKKLHTHHYGKAHEGVKRLRDQINDIHCLPNFDMDREAQITEKEYLAELRHWSKIEDAILRQKSRINWLKQGDVSTKFFFTATKARHAKNRIQLLIDDSGNTITDTQEIREEILKFYKVLLGTKATTLPGIDLNVVRKGKVLSA
ncbi:uncharacterized protein LOC104898633 [Beta vulgaris subsp. vulgaris]|uniref:uncharacterized protein LOC104898633 n=1 Tax=Beta vulgaris subsp. vulgaris TaxID=3555 RepID=UPI00053FB547|nr:uncharacterized protein LOC104898633 [Beta vulgaris subsp. vulgaris]